MSVARYAYKYSVFHMLEHIMSSLFYGGLCPCLLSYMTVIVVKESHGLL